MALYKLEDSNVDANAEIGNISPNKILIALKLTEDNPDKPEFVHDLTSPEEVFAHYKPAVTVEFKTENGEQVMQRLHFEYMKDFSIKEMTMQSPVLRDLTFNKDLYAEIARQIKTNERLRNILVDQNSKQSLLNILIALLKDLEANK